MTETDESALVEFRDGYARETRQRMDGAITDLRANQYGEISNIDRVLERLRLQEEASRLAGLQGISRLCRDIAACLAEARDGEQPRLATVARTLSDVCRTVQRHADTFGKRLPDPSVVDKPRYARATDAAHSMPPAPMLAWIAEQKGGHCGKSPTG